MRMDGENKILEGVKIGITFAKWGNLDENLLNRVISVKKLKIGGKNWNLLKIKIKSEKYRLRSSCRGC
jgi:hypothetical protein